MNRKRVTGLLSNTVKALEAAARNESREQTAIDLLSVMVCLTELHAELYGNLDEGNDVTWRQALGDDPLAR